VTATLYSPGSSDAASTGVKIDPVTCARDCCVDGESAATDHVVDPNAAEAFLCLFHDETRVSAAEHARRLAAVRHEIDDSGTYVHTGDELQFGARVAWRNSAKCIGRLYWNALHVRDRREACEPAAVAADCVEHLREVYRGGRIRPTVTVYAPSGPGRPGPRIHNEQLLRYAAHRSPDGRIVGDPVSVRLTDHLIAHGWRAPEPCGRFDVLPLMVSLERELHVLPVPPDAAPEIMLSHPEHDWFAALGLRWYAIPAVSDMMLEIGGVIYPAAPFNGWYQGTEIGARNLADPGRYDLLPAVARGLGLDMRSDRTMWRDRAAVELVRAVHHSFDAAGVVLADHHAESSRFLTHLEREAKAGRRCPADWTWIVPPISGALTGVFHRYYETPDTRTRPAFLRRPP
jgi:nitric-oxide synthase